MGGPKGGQACPFGNLTLTEIVMELQLIFSQEDLTFTFSVRVCFIPLSHSRFYCLCCMEAVFGWSAILSCHPAPFLNVVLSLFLSHADVLCAHPSPHQHHPPQDHQLSPSWSQRVPLSGLTWAAAALSTVFRPLKIIPSSSSAIVLLSSHIYNISHGTVWFIRYCCWTAVLQLVHRWIIRHFSLYVCSFLSNR